ncbi:MAG: DUF4097 family beta strand repeat protein [Candidatus Aegiribacteria sp.]|nr:DUF4097 family beta strand repeat protein [Candidatus Aegiribacteria sp.]MBD3295349.1 DUF4097 family beta strand repeat protein [Candidatus Fermentibacteria bacterium]
MKSPVFCLVFLLAAAVQLQAAVEETEVMTISPSAGDPLEISSISGDVVIEEWNSDEMEFSYTIMADDQDDIQMVTVRCDTEEGVICTVEYDDSIVNSSSARVDFSVMVPAGTALETYIELVSGDVNIHGGSGTAEVVLVSGDLDVADYSGELSAELVSGNMTASGCPGLRSAEVVSGDIDCIAGRMEDDVYLASVSGNVGLHLADEAAVSVQTISGDFILDDSFSASVTEGHGEKSAEFGSGEFQIEIETVSGSITVTR